MNSNSEILCGCKVFLVKGCMCEVFLVKGYMCEVFLKGVYV